MKHLLAARRQQQRRRRRHSFARSLKRFETLITRHRFDDRSLGLCLFLVELAFGDNAAAVTGTAIPNGAAEMPEAAVRLEVAFLLDIHTRKKKQKNCE